MTGFKHLFSPIRIGSMEVPNRIFMSPHGVTGLAIGSDQQVGYFEARARGGAGMLGIASCLVTPAPGVYPGLLIRAYSRDDIPALERIIDAIHKWGSKVFVQGVWMVGGSGIPQPSSVIPQSLFGGIQTRSMTIAEIEELVEAHATAAVHAQEAGADGVEFPIGGGAGLQSFVSPLYNLRSDRYGGSMQNRLRAIQEIIDRVRVRCGRDFGLGLAVNADESTLGGPALEDGVEVCRMLTNPGKIDWLRITARGQKPQMTHFHYPPSYFPQGTHLYAAAAVRAAVGPVPVVSGGRILTAEFAEQALAQGKCDLVFVARAVLADPEWPNKSRRGQREEIRACIGDLEGCFLRSCFGQPVGCTVNPEVGHEHEPPLAPAVLRKKVLIAGGGVAGMQAAMVAAQRGHTVTLCEKSAALGGHVRLQAELPGLGDRSDIVRWLRLQLDKLKVEIRLGCEATPDLVASLRADAVVVATGASYARTGISKRFLHPIPGADLAHVLTPEDIVLGGAAVGERVVVYDTTAYEVGPGVAELLADRGKQVTIVCDDSCLGASVTELGIHQVIAARLASKVRCIPDTAITRIGARDVTLQNILSAQQSTLEDVDTVILVTSRPPQEALYHALLGKLPELHVIGDARESRWNVFATDEAIKDGRRVGLLL